MEAAVEAGTLCANEILHRDNKKSGKSMKLTKTYPSTVTSSLLKPLIGVDKALHTLHLPHLSKLTFNSSLVLVGLYGLVLVSLAGLLVKQFI